MSRPREFYQGIADSICEKLAEGNSLRWICDDASMPSRKTVYEWLRDNEGFRNQYARAREDQADAIFDEILEIADDARNDWMKQNGEDAEGYRENGEAIRRSQMRIDARKWMAGKLRPKKYGDKLEIDGTITPSDPLMTLLSTIAENGKKITDH